MKRIPRCKHCGKKMVAGAFGNKALGEDQWHGKCFKLAFIARSVSLPLAVPIGCDWDAANVILKAAWAHSTHLANWAVRELLKADPGRSAKNEKPSDMPKVALNLYKFGFTNKRYPEWRAFAGCTTSAAQILRAVEGKYSKVRYAVQWRREQAPCTYRYPMPWPIHNQSWKPYRGQGGERCISVVLPGGRLDFVLRGGAEFARQSRTFDGILAGTIQGGTLYIGRQRSGGTKRQTHEDRNASGGKRIQFTTMARIAAWLPRVADKGKLLTLNLDTDANAFWVGQMEGREGRPWILNADHVRRRVQQHRVFLQRFSEDTKPEKRWPKRRREQMNEHRDQRCNKHSRFIGTWCQEASAMLAKFCHRNGVGLVAYRDDCHSYFPDVGETSGFPWYQLRLALASRLEMDGIELVTRDDQGATGEVA